VIHGKRGDTPYEKQYREYSNRLKGYENAVKNAAKKNEPVTKEPPVEPKDLPDVMKETGDYLRRALRKRLSE
jgi:hypothetical protein